jgi:hypothetical protein
MVAAAPGKLGKLRAEIRIPRTTPKVIEVVAVAMAVLAILAFITSYSAISRTSDAVLRIGYATKPSVVVAEKLSVALADMDAAITNSSLGSRKSWWRYVADADTAVAMAVEASRNLNAEDVEAKSLRRVLSQLRTYYQFVGGANAIATDASADQKLPLTMTLWASHGLRQDIIPEVEKISKSANANLEAAYAEYQGNAGAAIVKAMVPAGLLLALLLVVQVFLARRTHRLINVPLALGTALLTMFMGWFLLVSLSDARTLQAAKEDSFASILHLYNAKVASYLMKADESMWLFEQRKVRSDYAQSFANGSKEVLNIGNAYQLALADLDRPAAPVNEAAIEQLKSALADAERFAAAGNYAEAARLTPRGIPGYLGDELGHLAQHPAERKPATTAVTYFLRHIDIDTRIRTLESAGHHAEAVRLAIGDNEGGSNWAFQGMNAAIDEIINLNEAEFQADIGAASIHVVRMFQAMAGALVGAVLLAGFGLWQRYAEYR